MTGDNLGPGYTCVAGRAVPVSSAATPAIAGPGVVRLVALPTEMAYLRRGDAPGAGVPRIVTLGKDTDARLFLRFSAALPSESEVIEAYLILNTAEDVDSDPTPIALYATRVTDPWDARSISWAMQPHVEDTRSPATYITGSGRSVVRIDVGALVARWPEHDPRDQGLAIIAASTSTTGTALALASASGPRLEIYARMPTSGINATLPPAPDAGLLDGSVDAAASAKPATSSSARPPDVSTPRLRPRP